MADITLILKKIFGILNSQKTLISISEAALYLDVSESSIHRLLQKNDDILSIKEPGIGRRIIKSTLDRHFEKKIEIAIEKKENDDREIKLIVADLMSDITRQS